MIAFPRRVDRVCFGVQNINLVYFVYRNVDHCLNVLNLLHDCGKYLY